MASTGEKGPLRALEAPSAAPLLTDSTTLTKIADTNTRFIHEDLRGVLLVVMAAASQLVSSAEAVAAADKGYIIRVGSETQRPRNTETHQWIRIIMISDTHNKSVSSHIEAVSFIWSCFPARYQSRR